MLADIFEGRASGKTLRGGKFCTLKCVGGRKTDEQSYQFHIRISEGSGADWFGKLADLMNSILH
jgi:hypothetical protein